MMHYIYEFANGFPVEAYSSLQGWLIDRWVIKYAMDVKERTGYLANEVLEVCKGKERHQLAGGRKISERSLR